MSVKRSGSVILAKWESSYGFGLMSMGTRIPMCRSLEKVFRLVYLKISHMFCGTSRKDWSQQNEMGVRISPATTSNKSVKIAPWIARSAQRAQRIVQQFGRVCDDGIEDRFDLGQAQESVIVRRPLFSRLAQVVAARLGASDEVLTEPRHVGVQEKFADSDRLEQAAQGAQSRSLASHGRLLGKRRHLVASLVNKQAGCRSRITHSSTEGCSRVQARASANPRRELQIGNYTHLS